jgi:hypothetical protein
LGEDHFDTSILLSSHGIVIASDWRTLASSNHAYLRSGNSTLHERALDSARTINRQSHIQIIGPGIVGMAFDHYFASVVFVHYVGQAINRVIRGGFQR